MTEKRKPKAKYTTYDAPNSPFTGEEYYHVAGETWRDIRNNRVLRSYYTGMLDTANLGELAMWFTEHDIDLDDVELYYSTGYIDATWGIIREEV